jgi:2,4-dienoyl-CoA reductase-like NADH-dependent reductase (Old Yellow Enzyme family)
VAMQAVAYREMNPAYAALFEPLILGCGMMLPNRIIMAPMTTWSSHPDGTIHDDELRYLERRAGGLGMTLTAACSVIPHGMAFHGQWSCHADAMLPSLRRVADTLHAAGSPAILQLHHGGRMCPASLIGQAPWCASAIPAARPGADVPMEMPESVIHETLAAFADATRRAITAGYDGVEIHGANTYLPQQFFSPHSNRRHDGWGGGLEERMRFPLALVDAVVEAGRSAPRPFALGYRLSPEEIEDPGITIDDSLSLVDRLCTRPLDWLHVSVRDYRKGSLRDASDSRRPTSRIVETVARRMPVIGVGSIHSPDDALLSFLDGCELVALGRILLTEPEWITKVRSGTEATIRTALPASDGARLLTLPVPLYDRLLSVKGWVPVAE